MSVEQNKSKGFFKVYRSLFDHYIWLNSTPEQKVILITLLSMANHKPNKWEWKGKEIELEAGQFITSLESICIKCGSGITIQKVRTALTRFEKFNFLTKQSTKQSTLITIENWALYQGDSLIPNTQSNKHLTNDQQTLNKHLTNTQQTSNKHLTNDQQTLNKHLTTNKNVRSKECKNERNKECKNERMEEGSGGRATPTTSAAAMYYETNIGLLSTTVVDSINYYLTLGVEESLICKAIDEACSNNARSWKYIEAILNRCVKQNIYTVNQFEANEKNRKTKSQETTEEFNAKYAKALEDIQTFDEGANIFDIGRQET